MTTPSSSSSSSPSSSSSSSSSVSSKMSSSTLSSISSAEGDALDQSHHLSVILSYGDDPEQPQNTMAQLQLGPLRSEPTFNIHDHYPSIDDGDDDDDDDGDVPPPVGLIIGDDTTTVLYPDLDDSRDVEMQLDRAWGAGGKGKSTTATTRSISLTIETDSCDSITDGGSAGSRWWWCYCCWITPQMRRNICAGIVMLFVVTLGCGIGLYFLRSANGKRSSVGLESPPPPFDSSAPTFSPIASGTSEEEIPKTLEPSPAPAITGISVPALAPISALPNLNNGGAEEPPVEDAGSTHILPIITVGAFYEIHSNNAATSSSFRATQLQQSPVLDGSILQDLEWSKKANVRLWILDYSNETDAAEVWSHPDLDEHQLAWRVNVDQVNMTRLCDEYFAHPNYHRIHRRALLLVDSSSDINSLRAEANATCLEDLYIVGNDNNSSALDAVTDWDMHLHLSNPLDRSVVDQYYSSRTTTNVTYVPSVTPGYHTTTASTSSLPRYLSDGTNLMEYSLRQATKLIDISAGNLLLVNSFNRWSDDTQIVPTAGNDGYGDLYSELLVTHTGVWF